MPNDNEKTLIGAEPIDPKHVRQMQVHARLLDEAFNEGTPRTMGFVLLVFPIDDLEGDRCSFISNGATLDDVFALMRRLLDRHNEE